MNSISFFTVCKNRKHHYADTILKNIPNNLSTPNVEFLLLDYNSNDGLEDWVKENLFEFIESGVFTYYKTKEPQYFHRSHSRNMAFKLAKGEIVCNIDADNYIGQDFGKFVAQIFLEKRNFFLCVGGINDNILCSDIGGKICARKSDLIKIDGYDEEMDSYGFEDFDLINRLELFNYEKHLIKNPDFLSFISHETKERIMEEFAYKNIEMILIGYINPFTSRLLLLFKNDTFASGTLSDENYISSEKTIFSIYSNFKPNKYSILEKRWLKGSFLKTMSGLKLNYKESNLQEELFKVNENCYSFKDSDGEINFYSAKSEFMLQEVLYAYTQLSNRMKMEWNERNKILKVNDGKFGQGVVYKNFDYQNPITL